MLKASIGSGVAKNLYAWPMYMNKGGGIAGGSGCAGYKGENNITLL